MRIARSLHSVLRRVGRGLLVLAVLPAMLCGPFGTLAVVIHDHDDHDTHVHAFARNDVDPWQRHNDHHHPEDRRPSHQFEPRAEDLDGVVIVVEPVVAPRDVSGPRVLARSIESSSKPLPWVTALGETNVLTPRVGRRGRPFAPILRASDRIAVLLQSNHALLL